MWICILLYWTDLGWTDRKLRTQEERSRTESSRDRNEERIEATSYEMVGYVGTVFTIGGSYLVSVCFKLFRHLQQIVT